MRQISQMDARRRGRRWPPGLRRPRTAQSWPTQRVTIVVPFGAGSVTDILARIFADEMGQALEPAGHRREPARPRRHRRRRQGGAGWLHADGDLERPHRRGSGQQDAPFDPVKDFAGITRLGSAPLS